LATESTSASDSTWPAWSWRSCSSTLAARAAQVWSESDDAHRADASQQPAQGVVLAPPVVAGCRPRLAGARACLCVATDS
jgi:hypothetical protein